MAEREGRGERKGRRGKGVPSFFCGISISPIYDIKDKILIMVISIATIMIRL